MSKQASQSKQVVCTHFPADSPMAASGELCAECEARQARENMDQFTRAYVECALWSSSDNTNEQGGEPLDRNYGVEDIAPECLAEMIRECTDFQESNRELLAQADALYSHNPEWTHAEQAGHDFWLTRNRHGAGFWDRGLGDVGRKLTENAHVYGSVDLYVGDDGKVYA